MIRRPKHLGWIVLGLLMAATLVYVLLPAAVLVETADVRRGNLEGYVEAEGYVRFADRYVLSVPAAATLLRVTIEAGDSVLAGQPLATYVPPTYDARQRTELQARQLAARAAIAEASARVQAMRPIVEQARRKLDRSSRLLASGAIAQEQAELAADAVQQLEQELQAGEARVVLARHELAIATAAVRAPSGSAMVLPSPITGIVLRRYEEQERLLPAGTPILDVGNPASAEIVANVISMDAVNIRPGMPALVERWGGPSVLRATVRRVEPAARTTVSALGIEERRVSVVLVPDTIVPSLGDNYKVDTKIRLWARPAVLSVPLAALMRNADGWEVFVVRNNRAERQRVTLGMRTSLVTEVTGGLTGGERVVVHPPAALTSGARVRAWERP